VHAGTRLLLGETAYLDSFTLLSNDSREVSRESTARDDAFHQCATIVFLNTHGTRSRLRTQAREERENERA
jgi:hypothetical protein